VKALISREPFLEGHDVTSYTNVDIEGSLPLRSALKVLPKSFTSQANFSPHRGALTLTVSLKFRASLLEFFIHVTLIYPEQDISTEFKR
jgi:hypothetical protein